MNLTSFSRLFFRDLVKEFPLWTDKGGEIQENTLRNLLHYASGTEYGDRYGFRNLTSALSVQENFRRRVPVVRYEDIRQEVMRMVAGETDILWPGKCMSYAQSSGTSGGKSKYIPITEESLKWNHYKGAALCMARYLHLRPDSRIFSGRGLVLGGSFANEIDNLPKGVNVGDLSATLINRMNPLANLFRIPSKSVALMRDWNEKLPLLAQKAAGTHVTNLSGVPSWMLVVLREILKITGADTITDVWPDLEVFFHGGINFRPYRAEYDKVIPSEKMRYFETYNASEGFFAVMDNFGSEFMLLIPSGGVFYEFRPWTDDNAQPVGWDDVSVGKIYELLISAPNGLWRYSLGDTVRIEGKSPLRITIAGRTKTFINAFGEELMENNAEAAISAVCLATRSSIKNYTAGPLYAHDGKRGRHQWLIEWDTPPADTDRFASMLDDELRSLNSDYDAKRKGNIFLDSLQVVTVAPGTFDSWLKTVGNRMLGGQKKVPRLSNDRRILDAILG